MISPLLLLAAALSAQPTQPPEDCPPGYDRIATNNPIEPFHCKKHGFEAPAGFIPMIPNRNLAPHCPKGTKAVKTPGELSRWRCEKVKPAASDNPDLAPVLAQPDAKGEKGPEAPAAAGFAAPTEYLRYTITDDVQFEYPRDWRVVNGWQDEVPTLYMEFDTGRQGKQVSMVISKIVSDQSTYEDMDAAIAHEKEYQNVADGPKELVGGFPARTTFLAKTSRTAYVAMNKKDYFTLSYSAPDDLFKTYEPVYKRLLKTFKFAKRLQELNK